MKNMIVEPELLTAMWLDLEPEQKAAALRGDFSDKNHPQHSLHELMEDVAAYQILTATDPDYLILIGVTPGNNLVN